MIQKLGKICGRQAVFLLYLIENIKSSVLMDSGSYHWSMETAFWNSDYCSSGSMETHGHQNHLVPVHFAEQGCISDPCGTFHHARRWVLVTTLLQPIQ